MRPFLLAAAVLISDQLSKWAIQRTMELGQSIPVVDNIFHITYWRNPGAAFSLLPFRTTFFVIIGILVVTVIIVFFRRVPADRKLLQFALALQLGGAMGNLVDRVRIGSVVDFLDFRVWPVFNLADSAIVVGVILLSWDLLRTPDRPPGRTKVG